MACHSQWAHSESARFIGRSVERGRHRSRRGYAVCLKLDRWTAMSQSAAAKKNKNVMRKTETRPAAADIAVVRGSVSKQRCLTVRK